MATRQVLRFLAQLLSAFFEETFFDEHTTEISRGGSPHHLFKSLKRVALLEKTLCRSAAFNQVYKCLLVTLHEC